MLKELAAATKSRIREQHLTDHPNAAILCSALGQESKNHLSNAFILLDILTPGVRLQELYQNLTRSEEDRGNVIEVLENVLRGQVRTETLATIRTTNAPPCDDVEALLREFLDEPCSNWVKIGALHAIGQRALSQSAMLITDLRHSHPVVRETALNALADQKPDLAIQEARKLTDDEAPIVRQLAEEILEPELA